MITLTRLDGSCFVVNADLIETVESRPDTVVTLVTKKILVVKESPEVVIERVVDYRRRAGWAIGPSIPPTREDDGEPGKADPKQRLAVYQHPGSSAA
ncbi:MAG: flagellar protein FlbD [Chloroflexota bacterium]|nr:MAG: flagellar protein FlbD [Chloroflexota bacterium]